MKICVECKFANRAMAPEVCDLYSNTVTNLVTGEREYLEKTTCATARAQPELCGSEAVGFTRAKRLLELSDLAVLLLIASGLVWLGFALGVRLG